MKVRSDYKLHANTIAQEHGHHKQEDRIQELPEDGQVPIQRSIEGLHEGLGRFHKR